MAIDPWSVESAAGTRAVEKIYGPQVKSRETWF